MVNFIQNFRLRRIIITMEAIKCSWTIIYEAKPENWSSDTREELVCPRKRSGKNYRFSERIFTPALKSPKYIHYPNSTCWNGKLKKNPRETKKLEILVSSNLALLA